MNSVSSVMETNLVNFTRDLTTLNQWEAEETLSSFPFDDLYAFHADDPVRQTIQLDEELEISTQCMFSSEKEIVVDNNAECKINQLRDRLKYLECQNKRLKELVLFHLDFIQQQNESVTKTEKSNQSLKEENETLKSKVIPVNKKLSGSNQRPTIQPSPLLHLRTPKPVSTPVTATVVKSEPNQQIMLNSFKKLVLPPKKPSPFISFDGDVKNKKKNKLEPYPPSRSTDTGVPNLSKNDHNILDTSNISTNFKMIEEIAKKETKPEKRTEPLYTITSTSGNPVIQKIHRNKRRSSTGIGALNRMNKTSTANKEVADAKPLEDSFIMAKRRRTLEETNQFGSLSDILHLIDTTPTGEDPHQNGSGEVEMGERSPLPKLMLQETDHGGMNIKDLSEPIKTQRASKKSNENKATKVKNSYYEPHVEVKQQVKRTILTVEDQDFDTINTETDIDEASLCDFTFAALLSPDAGQIVDFS